MTTYTSDCPRSLAAILKDIEACKAEYKDITTEIHNAEDWIHSNPEIYYMLKRKLLRDRCNERKEHRHKNSNKGAELRFEYFCRTGETYPRPWDL